MTLLEKVQEEFAACLEKWANCNDSEEEIRLFNRLGRLEMLESALKSRRSNRRNGEKRRIAGLS